MGTTVLLLGAPALAAAARSPDLNVCAWGSFAQPRACTDGAWVEGNPSSAATYLEGDFVPFRVIFRPSGGSYQIRRGQTYTLEVGYDIATSFRVAYDYLGTYNASQPGRPPIIPCSGAGVTREDPPCDQPPSTTGVPQDVHTFFANGQHPPFGEPNYVFSAWGVHLDTATQATCPGGSPTIDGRPGATIPGGGPQPRCVDLTFTVPGTGGGAVGAVIAWSGHIATVADWGANKTYASYANRGAGFHMRLQKGGSFTSLGNQEIPLRAEAKTHPGLSTSVAPREVHPNGTVTDTAHLTGTGGTYPAGTVDFFVCGPASSATGCATGGVLAAQSKPVVTVPGSPTLGRAAIEFPSTEAPAPEGGLAPGFYCFRAEYTPAAYAPYLPGTHTSSTTECFEVKLTELAVNKVCAPETDTGRFDVHITGPGGFDKTVSVSCQDGGTGTFNVTPGTYTVTEHADPSNPHTYPPGVFGGDCTSTGEVTLALGESKTCTITNARVPIGTLTVDKVCDPVTEGRFTVVISNGRRRSPLRFEDLKCGESTGVIPLPPGHHTVAEESGTGTDLGHYMTAFSGDCAADGSVTVTDGGHATCTITNRQKPATLTVTKVCVPETDGGHFEITIDGATTASGTLGCGESTGPIPVTPGSHIVAEQGAGGTDLAAYDQTIGGDCDSGGHVAIAPGEDATCEISNVRRSEEHKVGELTLLKLCVPETDGGLFNLRIDGVTEHDQPCGGKVGPVALLPGTYHVGETAGTATDLNNYRTEIGGACGADGSIHLAAGQSKTCTITNVRHGDRTAVLTVHKLCRPAHDNGRFVLAVNELDLPGMRCGQSTGPITLAPGKHLVGEAAVPPDIADNYKIVIGGDCAADGTITLKANQHATCTVTNIRIPHAGIARPPHRPRPPKPPRPVVTG
ncbi:MAG: hypothetical protein JO152_11935 [Mycobacteriaceae bacterium]|nr:hypothetical protein [Mycobacteriaceae bacterium]